MKNFLEVAARGDLKTLQELIKKVDGKSLKEQLNQADPSSGQTALHQAVASNHLGVVKCLLVRISDSGDQFALVIPRINAENGKPIHEAAMGRVMLRQFASAAATAAVTQASSKKNHAIK